MPSFPLLRCAKCVVYSITQEIPMVLCNDKFWGYIMQVGQVGEALCHDLTKLFPVWGESKRGRRLPLHRVTVLEAEVPYPRVRHCKCVGLEEGRL